jgi:sugar/nucleoside kinase (ribokinase family)
LKANMILIAGHVCLDMIPALGGALPEPGQLAQVGPLHVAGGGAVANVGIALHRLGVPVRLLARVGDDPLGTLLREVFRREHPDLAAGLLAVAGQATSYTVVVSPPGEDRRFLHCPGANDSFDADDITPATLAGCTHLHFGYPTMMRRMFEDNGDRFVELLSRARHAGLTTSVDLTHPDPDSPAGRADWPAILARALPLIDLFCPSLPEVQMVMRRPNATSAQLAQLFLDLGCSIALIKNGTHGLYLHAASETHPRFTAWQRLRLHAPCFQVHVKGTTGSGDTSIAGLLAAIHRNLPPAQCLDIASAVGACCCEALDAVSGIRPWDATLDRINAGWPRHPPADNSPPTMPVADNPPATA